MDTSNIHEKSKKRRGITEYMPFLPALIAFLLRLIYRSCRFTILGEEHLKAAREWGGASIAAFWHCAFPGVLYFFRDNSYVTIISRSRDGELAARMVERLGYKPFRGSPGKGGATALKQIISAFRKAPGGGFVADGSQGPARIAQKGLLILALHSGCPILPVSMAVHPCWRFRSWDRTVLAKPFSRVVMAFGPLIRVERGATAEQIEQYRVELETTLNAITEAAEKTALGQVAEKSGFDRITK
jgi:lysophospholipid acyltransferase (LPLAT)-like uncharacterized protein